MVIIELRYMLSISMPTKKEHSIGIGWASAKFRAYRHRPQLLQMLVEHRRRFFLISLQPDSSWGSAPVDVKVPSILYNWGDSRCVMIILGIYTNLKS